MWLLDTTTIQLQLFLTTDIPHYAILSHTWGDEEVTLQDLQCNPPRNQHLAGYIKILDCCAQARLDGFEYVWIDTCCIDKTNSAELSEAINSMFTWYRDAVQCYAFLSDIESVEELPKSRWFMRGWTLQELIAPLSVIFFNKYWKELGTKASITREIATITNIPRAVLLSNSREDFSVAQIMSWAAKRETTRVEDRAYSLLGLFGVNMPMIYGEGNKAFRRLQLEIMKESRDHSIFAWRAVYNSFTDERGPLALSPTEFGMSGNVKCVASESNTAEYAMTNSGLRIKLSLTGPFDIPPHGLLYIAWLDCNMSYGGPVGLYIRQKNCGQFLRARCSVLCGSHTAPNTANTTHEELHFIEVPQTLSQWSQTQTLPGWYACFDVNYQSVLDNDFVLAKNPYTCSEYSSWTVGAHMTGLTLGIDSSGKGEVQFEHEGTGEAFVATIGMHRGRVSSLTPFPLR